jgi:hypothetical protein
MAGETPHELAVALVTANLNFRIKAEEQGRPGEEYTQLPEYRLYVDLWWDDAAMGEVEPADVLAEMTQLVGTAIWRLAAYRSDDPRELWQAIALESARRNAEDEPEE